MKVSGIVTLAGSEGETDAVGVTDTETLDEADTDDEILAVIEAEVECVGV